MHTYTHTYTPYNQTYIHTHTRTHTHTHTHTHTSRYGRTPLSSITFLRSEDTIRTPMDVLGSAFWIRISCCTYVFVYVCMYVGMYVWMYVCMYVRMYVYMYVCMYVCTYASARFGYIHYHTHATYVHIPAGLPQRYYTESLLWVCKTIGTWQIPSNVCMYACMYVRMYVCMYGCMYVCNVCM